MELAYNEPTKENNLKEIDMENNNGKEIKRG